jgi:hypothetical protein
MVKRARSPVWRAILLFTLAGPLIGSAPFALLFTVIGFQLKDGPLVGILPVIFGLVLGLPLAFLAGCTFATVNLFANGYVTRSLPRATVTGAISGLFAAALALAFFPDVAPSPSSDKTPNPSMFFYVVSTLAGAICGAIFFKRHKTERQ